MDALRAIDLQPCRKPGVTGRGRVAVTFGSDGSAQGAVVDGSGLSGVGVVTCLAERYQTARVPPFSGTPVRVEHTFMVE